MSKKYYGSLCFTDLHEALKAGHSAGSKGKNGKIYVNVDLWINDEKDQYGNDAALQLSVKKDSADKKLYIANLKESERKEAEVVNTEEVPDLSDLPF